MKVFIFMLTFNLLFLNVLNHVLNCKICGNEIGNSRQLIDMKSDVSLQSTKKFILGKNIMTHTFKNNHNNLFEIYTLQEANLLCQNISFEDNTFFRGYSWSMCQCGGCGIHQGWKFKPIEKYCEEIYSEDSNNYMCIRKDEFYGLVLSNVKYDTSISGEEVEL